MVDLFPQSVPRPLKLPEEKAREVARECLKYLSDLGDLEDCVTDLIAIPDHVLAECDGYKITKWLEDHKHLDGDFAIAEAMDGYYVDVKNEIERLQKQWVIDCNIQPPYPVGTVVKAKWQPRMTIMSVSQYDPATYLCQTDEQIETGKGWSYNYFFEDVTPIAVSTDHTPT